MKIEEIKFTILMTREEYRFLMQMLSYALYNVSTYNTDEKQIYKRIYNAFRMETSSIEDNI